MKTNYYAFCLFIFGLLTIPLKISAAGIEEFEGWLRVNQTADFQFLPGTKITFENCQDFLPFVPPAYQQQGFCFEGMEYTLSDPGDLSPPIVFKEATEKFYGMASLDAEGAIDRTDVQL